MRLPRGAGPAFLGGPKTLTDPRRRPRNAWLCGAVRASPRRRLLSPRPEASWPGALCLTNPADRATLESKPHPM